MNDADFYVYLISRLNGTPCYVGKGKGRRWDQHALGGSKVNRHLYRIIKQARAIGQELPKVKIAENLTADEAFLIELETISRIGRRVNGGPLVNLTDGGDGLRGYVPPPEHRAKTSAAMRGRKKSPEHIANAAAARVGKKLLSGWWSTEEGRAKQRANNPGNTGCKFSDDAREKIRRAAIRQFSSSKARKAVITSPSWAARNSVRHYQAA